MKRAARPIRRVLPLLAVGSAVLLGSSHWAGAGLVATAGAVTSASSTKTGFAAGGAIDGNRFSVEPSQAWQGAPGQGTWWWQVRFPEPREVGAILQVFGDHPFVLRDAPRDYLWQWSSDGRLAILAEVGVDHAWDCPHCRNTSSPKTPIYTHLGHTGARPCGDYSACIFERGPNWIRPETRDPVFAGLAEEFLAMESHCGQIEYPPKGWQLIATAGAGTKTKTQCLRRQGRYIYAAQFHIEMEGTADTSRRIMANFLDLARRWGGYNPNGSIE
jgi:hypothetical protein